jgi:hypothetical protein
MPDAAPTTPTPAPTQGAAPAQAQPPAQKQFATPAEAQAAAEDGASPAKPEGQQATADKKAEAVRLKKLKVYGKERELPEPLVDSYAQKYLAGEVKLEQLTKKEKELLEREARLKDPKHLWKTLQELGLNPRELAESHVAESLQEELLTPEQKHIRELERKLGEREEQDKSAQEKAQAEAHKAEVQKHQDAFADLFMGAMSKAGLPRESARVVLPRMASLYAANEEAGVETTDEELAAHALDTLKSEHKAVFGKMSLDEKLSWLGDDFLLELRRHDIKQMKARLAGGAPAPQARPANPEPKPTPPGARKGRWELIENEFLK